MKGFFTLFMAVLACLCFAQSANAWQKMKGSDRNTCGKKNPDVVNAIENFCIGNKAMVVPSAKARNGAWSQQGRISVWIRGANCKPPQWVPEVWCMANFFNMCVNMSDKYKATAYYGKDGGCQAWRIKQFDKV